MRIREAWPGTQADPPPDPSYAGPGGGCLSSVSLRSSSATQSTGPSRATGMRDLGAVIAGVCGAGDEGGRADGPDGPVTAGSSWFAFLRPGRGAGSGSPAAGDAGCRGPGSPPG